MKNLHKISANELTSIQLGILNYYDRQNVTKVIFYSDGRVGMFYESLYKDSWARWNTNDWISYIKALGVLRPAHQLKIKYEFAQ